MTFPAQFMLQQAIQIPPREAEGDEEEELPEAPEGFAYIVNGDGRFLVNGDGAFLLASMNA